MKRVAWFGVLVLLALLLFGCGNSKEQAAQELEKLNLKVFDGRCKKWAA